MTSAELREVRERHEADTRITEILDITGLRKCLHYAHEDRGKLLKDIDHLQARVEAARDFAEAKIYDPCEAQAIAAYEARDIPERCGECLSCRARAWLKGSK